MFLQEEYNHCITAAPIDNSNFEQMGKKGIAPRNAEQPITFSN